MTPTATGKQPSQKSKRASGGVAVLAVIRCTDPETAKQVVPGLRDELQRRAENTPGVQGVSVKVRKAPIPLPELWGATEAAEHLGIASHTNLYKVPGLPAPAVTLNRGRLWVADEVRAFAKQRAET